MLCHRGSEWRRVYLAGLVAAAALSLILAYILYTNALSLASCTGVNCYVSDEVYYVNVARKIMINIFGVHRGSWWPSSDKIKEDYYNLEHPPLAKYIIGLSMVLLGDKPIYWRIPSILFTAALPFMVYMAAARYLKPPISILAGLLAGLAVFLDPVVQSVGSLAMLDPFLAFFTFATVLLALYDRRLSAAFMLGLAVSVKYSGFFIAPFLYAYMRMKGMHPLKSLLYTLLIPSLVLLTVNIPIIMSFGFQSWLNQSVVGAIEWHTTSRGAGPPASTPWGWILNSNYFVLSYVPHKFPAVLNTPVYLLALLESILLFPLFIPGKRYYGIGAFLSVWLGYVFTYIAGNHTLYSFYTIQLAPLAALAFSELLPVLNDLSTGVFKQLYLENLAPYRKILFDYDTSILPEEVHFLPWFKKGFGWHAVLMSLTSIMTGLYFLGKPSFYGDYIGVACIVSHGYPGDPMKAGFYAMIMAALLIPILAQDFYLKPTYPKPLSAGYLILLSAVALSSFNSNSLITPLIILSTLALYRNRTLGLYLLGFTAYSIPTALSLLGAVLAYNGLYGLTISSAGLASSMILAYLYCGHASFIASLKYMADYRVSMNLFNILGGISIELQAILIISFFTMILLYSIEKRRKNMVPVGKTDDLDGLLSFYSLLGILLYSLTNIFSPDRIAPLLFLAALYNGYTGGKTVYVAIASILSVIALYIVPVNQFISQELFKYTPQSAMDPYAIHNVLSYIAVIVFIAASMLGLKEVLNRACIERLDRKIRSRD